MPRSNILKNSDSLSHEGAAATSLRLASGPLSKLAYLFLRSFEIIFSVIALLLSLPLIMILAVMIRLDSPGPAFFRQQRIAKGGKPFTFLKLRTHHIDAAVRFPDLCAYQFSDDEVGDVRLQIENDPRVTRVGHWLRQTSLDELPNFWHVLTGDMALVGPRPEMLQMRHYYHGESLDKFSVRPGITGLAQVSGRGDLTFAETIRLDLEYVHNHSLKNDFKILLKTIRMMATFDGGM